MDILENELVAKYFRYFEEGQDTLTDAHVALRVLRAMQQPIRPGDRALYVQQIPTKLGQIDESIAGPDDFYADFHPYYLRLPDRWQKRECPCGCHTFVHKPECIKCSIPALEVGNPVEEKIKECLDLMWKDPNVAQSQMYPKLLELVELARQG